MCNKKSIAVSSNRNTRLVLQYYYTGKRGSGSGSCTDSGDQPSESTSGNAGGQPSESTSGTAGGQPSEPTSKNVKDSPAESPRRRIYDPSAETTYGNADSSPVSVGQVLREELHLTRRQISRVKFRENGILVNGEPARVTRILQPGDAVCVNLSDEKPASSRLVPSGNLPEILYEDPDVICVYKPAGIIIHPSGDHDQDSLANQVAEYLQQKGEDIQVRPVGRLDRGVTGIVVFARHRLSAARLWEQRRDGRFIKEYLAGCKGVFPPEALE